jgi:hypothetical protein
LRWKAAPAPAGQVSWLSRFWLRPRRRDIGFLCKPFCPSGKRREFFPAKRLGIPRAAINNLSGRKKLDHLPLGRYIGSSRPAKLSA